MRTTIWFSIGMAAVALLAAACSSSSTTTPTISSSPPAGASSYWPPVPGPAAGGYGVTGALTTINRSDGSLQAAYAGHPLYTYVGDSTPGQAKGNGLNLSGGVWHEVTASVGAAPAANPSSGYYSGGQY